MSSRIYSTDLTPEPAMRRIVVAAAWAAMILGLITIISLPIDGWLRVAGISIWLIATGAELTVISSAHKRFDRIRLHSDGQVELHDGDGHWRAATIGNGCVVLRKLAWVRLKPATGARYHELLRRNSRESEQWRRLQVIWRHLGAAS